MEVDRRKADQWMLSIPLIFFLAILFHPRCEEDPVKIVTYVMESWMFPCIFTGCIVLGTRYTLMSAGYLYIPFLLLIRYLDWSTYIR